MGAFSLTLGNGLQAGANQFGHVAGIKQNNRDDHLNQLVEDYALGHEQWKHRRRHKQHGNQWYRTEQFDESGAQHPDRRQPGTPTQGKDNPARQCGGYADPGYHHGEKQSAPFGPGDALDFPAHLPQINHDKAGREDTKKYIVLALFRVILFAQQADQEFGQAATGQHAYDRMQGISDQANDRGGDHDLHEDALIAASKQIPGKEGI